MRRSRPGPPRRLWSEVPAGESAIALLIEHGHDLHARRRGGGGSYAERLGEPERFCIAAKPWPWSTRPSDPPEGWLPCTRRVVPGGRFCWVHGGDSLSEWEGTCMAKCDAENKVDIEIRTRPLTLETLPDFMGLIERHAAAANAPKHASVTFEDRLVRARGDSDVVVAHVTWSLED